MCVVMYWVCVLFDFVVYVGVQFCEKCDFGDDEQWFDDQVDQIVDECGFVVFELVFDELYDLVDDECVVVDCELLCGWQWCQ